MTEMLKLPGINFRPVIIKILKGAVTDMFAPNGKIHIFSKERKTVKKDKMEILQKYNNRNKNAMDKIKNIMEAEERASYPEEREIEIMKENYPR